MSHHHSPHSWHPRRRPGWPRWPSRLTVNCTSTSPSGPPWRAPHRASTHHATVALQNACQDAEKHWLHTCKVRSGGRHLLPCTTSIVVQHGADSLLHNVFPLSPFAGGAPRLRLVPSHVSQNHASKSSSSSSPSSSSSDESSLFLRFLAFGFAPLPPRPPLPRPPLVRPPLPLPLLGGLPLPRPEEAPPPPELGRLRLGGAPRRRGWLGGRR